MKVVFDPSLDEPGWPGPVGQGRAVIGEAWLGPRGLLARLELELGLAGIVATPTERTVALIERVAAVEGYWSRSFDADALGTAARLLADRDRLWLWGWRGEPVSERLAALGAVTEAVLPGTADRLLAVCAELRRRRPDLCAVEVTFPEVLLPPLWRRVLGALREAGVSVTEALPRPAPARGDLGAARASGFVPAADGTLTLFRPDGPLTAAEEVAGALAARDSLEGVLVVGADRVLADAMVRAGLPRPAAPAAPPQSLAALRLVVELMFRPSDPALVYKLLCLDPGPIPRRMAQKLARALGQFPGRGTPAWSAAIDEGLQDLADERRDRVRARVVGLLEPVAPRDQPVPVDAVVERMRLLATWARGVAERTPSVAAVAAAAEDVSRLVRAMPATALRWVELRRLLDAVDDRTAPGEPAEAGLATVREPGAVLGPSPLILWWGFTRDRAPRPPRLRLSQAEKAALEARGITPPSASLHAAGAALRWRRPLEQASRALVLVCPRTIEAGETGFPHPLWDELTAAMGGPHHAARLITRALTVPAAPRRVPVPLRPVPQAQVVWDVGRPVPLREGRESPSSLEKLLGCSLRWALEYHGRLRPRFSPPAGPSPLLYGTIAHHLMAQVFGAGPLDPIAARARAEAVVRDELPILCETLFLPRYQVELAQLQQAIVDSAAALATLITTLGATIRGVEHPLDRELPELHLSGIADLLLSAPDAVIDLKWSKSKSLSKLENGTALQLAAYAELARTGPARPAVAYFILRNQELLAEPGTCFPDAAVPGEHQAIDIWRGALSTLAKVQAELAAGRLHAPAALGDDIDEGLAGGALTLDPGCRYCAHGVVCGQGAGR